MQNQFVHTISSSVLFCLCDGTDVLASRNFEAKSFMFPEELSSCLISPRNYILYIHSRKCDCFFPTGLMQFISCGQRRAPRGPTKRVIYMSPLDHLRILKMRLLCKLNNYCMKLSMS